MTKRMSVGIIGCGYISSTYLRSARTFPIIDIRGIADLSLEASAARAAEFGVHARSVEELLADPEIELIINLTVPKAHLEVGLRAIAAGKHLYSEKPLGVSSAEARELLLAAHQKGRRVGCAPDTFLGGGQQTARKLVDEGAIGDPIGGTAFFMWPGHERWHPSPAFYYLQGGGPIFDMGPYYITALVNLLGPVARVVAMTSRPQDTRVVSSEPLRGTFLRVEVDTHVCGTLQFHCGTIVSMTVSFDIKKHKHTPLELYGTLGSMILPDPDGFGGNIEISEDSGPWRSVQPDGPFTDHFTRIIGAAEMIQAILEDRDHRASGALAAHVLEVIEAFGLSSSHGSAVEIQSRPPKPEPLKATDLMSSL